MLKAGIFLDMENLTINGGWGMRLDVVKELVEAQNTVVLRANAYIAVDSSREKFDQEYRDKARKYRQRIREAGFHIVEKEIKRYRNEDGTETVKANADLDMAVDAILQAENLDYIMLGSGDGDFLRLVRALQSKGKRVDAIAFENVSSELRREVDYYFPGLLVPEVLPIKEDINDVRYRGVLEAAKEREGFGFISIRTGHKVTDIESGIFCHISQVTEHGMPIRNERFADLEKRGTVLEFDRVASERGIQAENVVVYHNNQ